jgi:hypothetical protein
VKYPTTQDLTTVDRLERTMRDIYDKVYMTQQMASGGIAATRKMIADYKPSAAVVRDLVQSAPPNINGWLGVLAQPQPAIISSIIRQGLYSARPVVTVADDGSIYDATDQNTLYIVVNGAWVWAAGLMTGTLSPDQRPALVAGDVGFLFRTSDTHEVYRWSGTVWAQLTLAIDSPTLVVDPTNHRIGVGIAAPHVKLEVHTVADGNLSVRPGSDFGAGYTGVAIQATNDLFTLTEMLVIGGTPIVLLHTVGIDTPTPAAKLAINGGVHVGGDSDPGDNNLLVDGFINAVSGFQQNGVAAANAFLVGNGTNFVNTPAATARGAMGAAAAASPAIVADTIPLAKITTLGTDGSITVNAEGIVIAYVKPT